MGYRKALNWVAEVTAEHWTMMTSRLSKSKMALPCRISAFSPVDRLRQAVPQAPSEPPDRPSTDRRMDSVTFPGRIPLGIIVVRLLVKRIHVMPSPRPGAMRADPRPP